MKEESFEVGTSIRCEFSEVKTLRRISDPRKSRLFGMRKWTAPCFVQKIT